MSHHTRLHSSTRRSIDFPEYERVESEQPAPLLLRDKNDLKKEHTSSQISVEHFNEAMHGLHSSVMSRLDQVEGRIVAQIRSMAENVTRKENTESSNDSV